MSHAEAVDITRALLRRWKLPAPGEGDKESRGRILVVAGSACMPGAGVLAGTAALRAGAGKLQVLTPKSAAPWIALAIPEALVVALPEARAGALRAKSLGEITALGEHCRAVVVGPGLVGSAELDKLVTKIVRRLKRSILILDAEGLRCLEKNRLGFRVSRARVIVTPHAGEMASILGIRKESVLRDPAGTARVFARRSGAVTVLKGKHTYVAAPSGELYINRNGNVGLATSGSGDTLAGIIGGLAARGSTSIQAAEWGVALHAMAGDVLARKIGSIGYLPREIIEEIPRIMQKCNGKSPAKSSA